MANNPIKLSVGPVTPLAVARGAPDPPAAYRVRWTDHEDPLTVCTAVHILDR
jgi:hypothetical protein